MEIKIKLKIPIPHAVHQLYILLQSRKAHQVTQFHIVNWNTDGSCANLKTITDVIEEVTKVQMRSGNNPIVVHCR